MTRFAYTLTFTLVLSVAAATQSPPAPPPTPPAPWANKFFLPDIAEHPDQPAPPVVVHKFGTMPKGTLAVHRFKVTNVYDVPMQVIDIRRSCGCLQAYPPEKVLQPGEQSEFVVTLDTAQFTGANAQTIFVTFGPQYVSTAVLRVEGTSRADVMLSPGAVNFGTVAQGAGATQAVTLEYSGRQRDWKVTEVVRPAGALDVAVQPAAGPGAWLGQKYQVTVSLKPGAPAGPLAEVVSLKTNDPTAPVIQVNVTGAVQAPLTLSTTKVEFTGANKVKVGETAAVNIILRASGTDVFTVQPVPDAGDGLAFETGLPAAAPIQIVKVRFSPTKPGKVSREVVLKTDLKGGATATVSVEAEAVGP